MTIPDFIRENQPLAPLTTYGIGGEARYFAEPMHEDEVGEVYDFARRTGIPVLALGGGSNLLVADGGVNAVVVRLRGEAFSTVQPDEAEPLVWRVGAAAALPGLVEKAAFAGLGGLESLAGIPGRVGGAAAMNAGGPGDGIGRLVSRADGYDANGRKVSLSGSDLGFCYRGSALVGMCVLSLTLRFTGKDDPNAMLERVRHYREIKRETQPVGRPSAGCIFKNPPGMPAGMLLDRAGCKGMREGGAEVSRQHANFIVNTGGARSGDVLRLAARMRDMVFSTAGVVLEPEVRIWGDDPDFSVFRKNG